MSEEIVVSDYLRGHSEILNNIARDIKVVAGDILNYHGGIGCDSATGKYGFDLLGNAGLLEHIADYMLEHAASEEAKND